MWLVALALAAPPFPLDLPGESDGALAGTEVYLSQCHGWIWYDSLDDFSTQRGNLYDTVEDFHNPEATNQALAPFLHNAGADVWMVKERDHGDRWAIADNDDGNTYAESGSGFGTGDDGFADWGTWAFGENPFESGSTRLVPTGSVATFTLRAPQAGWQAVYVAYDADSSLTTEALYTLSARGTDLERVIDQTAHGSTWRYLDTLYFEPGDTLTVTLTPLSGTASADALRIGGGTGVIERQGETTGRPRWEEGAILATQFNGAPESVYDPYGDGNGSDPSSRALWAAWEHPSRADALYVSWHSNACDECDARGTGVYVYDRDCSSGAPTEGSELLAELLQEEIVAVGRAWDPEWQDRGTKSDCFSEVNPSLNDEMPAALIEIAFHDTEADIEILKDPAFRVDASRAIYRAIARYFEGDNVRFLPEPPLYPSLRNTDSGLHLSWTPGWSGDLWGDSAEHYLVQTSTDGRAWTAGTKVDGTEFDIDAATGDLVFARVVAVNDGGVSFPSSVVAARRGDGPPLLLVNAFDRLDTGLLPWEDLGGSVGEVRRMDLQRLNAGDILVPHALAVAALGWPFDSVEDESLPALDDYRAVVWATAEESTVDASFSDAQQATIRAYVEGGGALWATGAEILWDLDAKGDADEQAFAEEVLGARYASDDCECTRATGRDILAGVEMSFTEVYPVEYADALDPEGTVIAEYPDGTAAAALHGTVALFGFPFEAIDDEAVRAEVAAAVLGALVPGYEPPVDTGDGDESAGGEAGSGDPPGTLARPEAPGACGCATGSAAPWFGVASAVAQLWRRRANNSGAIRPSTRLPAPD